MKKDLETGRRSELCSPKYREAYLRDHYRKGPDEFRIALREVVLSQEGGFVELSRRTGLARTGLYKALSAKGNPSYHTVHLVLDALGFSTILTLKAPQRNNAKSKVVQEEQNIPKNRILPGSGKGLFVMADDFDDPLPEFSEYM